ncbi:MAG: hypothetical protein ACR2FG_13560 [Marmoricola sp.]
MTMGPADIERKLRQHDSEIIELYTKLDAIQATVEQHDRRFDQVDRRFDQVDQKFDQVDRRFDQVDQKFGQVTEKVSQLDGKVDTVLELLRGRGTTPR